MECPRGWILAKNNSGFDVPFFVKIRNADIFYPTNISNKFYHAGVLDTTLDGPTSILIPSQTYLMDVDGWNCRLSNNETFEFTKEFPIGTSFVVSDNLDKLEMSLSLPWKVSTDDFIDINIYKECLAKDLILSHINIVKDQPSETNDIQHLMIELYKHDGATFDQTCLTNEDYIQSKITVTIRGTAQLGDYSHIDDGGNVGFSWEAATGNINVDNVYTKTQIDNLINELRQSIENGKALDPSNIIDLVEDISETNVLPDGFVLDIDESALKGISESDELSEKSADASILDMNL